MLFSSLCSATPFPFSFYSLFPLFFVSLCLVLFLSAMVLCILSLSLLRSLYGVFLFSSVIESHAILSATSFSFSFFFVPVCLFFGLPIIVGYIFLWVSLVIFGLSCFSAFSYWVTKRHAVFTQFTFLFPHVLCVCSKLHYKVPFRQFLFSFNIWLKDASFITFFSLCFVAFIIYLSCLSVGFDFLYYLSFFHLYLLLFLSFVFVKSQCLPCFQHHCNLLT